MKDQTPSSIEIRGLEKKFGGLFAVAGIDLTIRRGEFVVIMGPSGCGKTTTLRMIAGLEKPDGGDILIDSKRVNDLKPWQRDTPLVWQNFALFPHLTVSENVEYGLRTRGIAAAERRARALKVLETVGLAGFEDRDVTKLSGGQKQRVGLARALVLDPKILLLDEPLGALDAKIGKQMQQELRNLHRILGITFVYVTHNQAEAMSLADRIVIMSDGRIQQIGTPHELFRKPRNRFVAEFMGSNNLFQGTVEALSGSELRVETDSGQFSVPRSPERSCKPGDKVSFVVAADHLLPGQPASAKGNRITARVSGMEMMGSMFSLDLDTTAGRKLQTHLPSAHFDTSSFPIGGEAEFHWDPNDGHLLVED
jgi:spermidine/putrescine transport system ATP-binding protein